MQYLDEILSAPELKGVDLNLVVKQFGFAQLSLLETILIVAKKAYTIGYNESIIERNENVWELRRRCRSLLPRLY